MNPKKENPNREGTRSGQNSKIKSTPKISLNRQILFVKEPTGSSYIKLPPVTTSYIERIAKKLGVEPGGFLSELIQIINLVYEPWNLK